MGISLNHFSTTSHALFVHRGAFNLRTTSGKGFRFLSTLRRVISRGHTGQYRALQSVHSRPTRTTNGHRVIRCSTIDDGPIGHGHAIQYGVFRGLQVIRLSSTLMHFFVRIVPIFSGTILGLGSHFKDVRPKEHTRKVSTGHLRLFGGRQLWPRLTHLGHAHRTNTP